MDTYDLVVLGSGIAGSITALVLKQVGLKTLVVERKSHPRFVIGESTLPTTSFLLNQLAHTYQVPEVAQVAHYITLRENGCAAWPKQHFWYSTHTPGAPLEPRHEHMMETLMLPIGPDVHMLREDADAFLAGRLERYGVDYLENTELIAFRSEPGGVHLRFRSEQKPEREVRARLVVDATGHASFLARRFGLRDEDARLDTNTRSLFGHFRDVADLDEVLGGTNPMYRFRRNAGTMHHCFEGGWIWVIPFDNGVTSVGVQLDRRRYPLDESVSPESELATILARYPSVKAHLGHMVPIRPLIRTDRVQFTSKSILGDGFILTPHAAAFIEPLFSTGILLTLAFISRLAPAVREAAASGDWNTERFRFIERLFFAEVEHIDRLVNGMIQSFRYYDLFKQYWRNWSMGTFAQWSTAVLAGGATRDAPMLYGSAFPGFREQLANQHTAVCQPSTDPAKLAAQLKALIDPWWERLSTKALAAYGDLGLGSRQSLCVRGAGQGDSMQAFARELAPVESTIDLKNVEALMQRTTPLEIYVDRYRKSRSEGSDFRRAFEQILNNQNPSTFDYYRHLDVAPR